MIKENVSINKTKLYRLVRNCFEGSFPEIRETEYRRCDNHSGWLYFYSDDVYYKAFFDIQGKNATLGIDEVDALKAEAGEELFSRVYHPSDGLMKNVGIYKEIQLKV